MVLDRVRALILDVDGVLLDARPSYWAVAEEAARRALAPVVGEDAARTAPFAGAEEIPAFKSAGHFNDDWEMCRGIALLLWLRARGEAPPLKAFLAAAGGRGIAGLLEGRALPDPVRAALDPERIARLCGALYGGDRCRALFGFEAREALPDAPTRGAWQNETLLPDPALLEAVQARFPIALFTGRNPGEAQLALELCRLHVPEPLRWVADGRPRKPDATGLVELCRLLPHRPGDRILFVGDTADDLAASRAAQDRGAPLIYAHVERPGDTTRVLARLLAEAAGEPE